MTDDELDIELARPETYIISVRLNREESRALTEAARFHGLKLGSYIKREALRSALLPQIRMAEEITTEERATDYRPTDIEDLIVWLGADEEAESA